MWTRVQFAALMTVLVCAAPVSAQPVAPVKGPGLMTVDPLPANGVVAGHGAGFRVDRQAFIADNGESDIRQGIVGTLPIAKNTSIGVGLYRVTRYSRGEPNFRRLRPMEDVDGRQQRVAAVGMSFRF